MPEEKAVFPPGHREKLESLRKAFDAYLEELDVLRSERNDIIRKFMERVERGKIDDVRKMLDDID